MLSCNVLIAHSVGDLEGEIRIFVEAEPGFCLAFRIVPDGGIFFGVFSHGLQLAEVGGYGLVLYDIYLSQPVYYRAVAAGETVRFEHLEIKILRRTRSRLELARVKRL